MAPLQTTRPPSTPDLSPRTKPRTMNDTRVSPEDVGLPPSPENETATPTTPLTHQLILESDADLESESDLPSITPPPTRQLPFRHRNASPPTNTTRVSSAFHSSPLMMPPMQRAHSSPGADLSSRSFTPTQTTYPRRPISPLNSGRRRSPLRSAFDEAYPTSSWSSLSIEPNIPEHAELELSTPVTPENEFGNISAIPTYGGFSNALPRSRRKPASPLHQSASAPSLHASARAAGFSGPSNSLSALSATRYANEPYPTYGYSFSSTSSMPSTPTSLRSRSPSISSLETIEDTPDAEEAARMEDETTKQHEMDVGAEPKRKSLDLRTTSLRSNKDRKRWSVCGAERRADFSLEVIEE